MTQSIINKFELETCMNIAHMKRWKHIYEIQWHFSFRKSVSTIFNFNFWMLLWMISDVKFYHAVRKVKVFGSVTKNLNLKCPSIECASNRFSINLIERSEKCATSENKNLFWLTFITVTQHAIQLMMEKKEKGFGTC